MERNRFGAMTEGRRTRRREPGTGGWSRRYLQSNGIKRTSARETIVEVMAEAPGHPSAEDIYIEVHWRQPAVGLTTVYRTLHILARKGLAHKLNFGDGRARYELVEKPKGLEHHHHLVCVRCQNIFDYTDFLDEEIELVRKTERSLAYRYEFEITDHMMQFYGICAECRSEDGEKNESGDPHKADRKRVST